MENTELQPELSIDYSKRDPAWNFDNPIPKLKLQREIVSEMVKHQDQLAWTLQKGTAVFAKISEIIHTDPNFVSFVDSKDWEGAKRYLIGRFEERDFQTDQGGEQRKSKAA